MSTIVYEQTEQAESTIRPVPILIALVVAGFVGLFSETALNMALGNLMHELNVASSTVQWVTAGYLLTMGIVIPVSAFTAGLILMPGGAIVIHRRAYI